jgi:hypothetical protein
MGVDRRIFVLSLSFILATDCDSGYAPEVVIGILPRTFNLQISFLVYEILPFVLAHLEIRRQLNRVSGTRFFAIATEDTAGKIDPKELRISPAVLVLRCLKRDAVHRTGHGAEVASDAAFSTVGILRKNNATTIPRREIGLFLWILNCHTPRKGVPEDFPQRAHEAEHKGLLHFRDSTTAPVTSKFNNARGSITFQPHDIN